MKTSTRILNTHAANIHISGRSFWLTLIFGLGGVEDTEGHAIDSAGVINAVDPEYLGLLTLTVDPGTEMYDKVNQGELTPLTPHEVMVENRLLVERPELSNCILRSNHVCNYVPLAATLGRDKQMLLRQLNALIRS